MKSNKRLLPLIALLVTAALVAGACGQEEEEPQQATPAETPECNWVIGTIGALSGENAGLGISIFRGIEYGVEQVNQEGNLACELRIQQEDSQGTPEQAPPLVQSLVENERLVAVVGPYFSGETLATGDVFNQARIPFLCPSCTNETIDDQGWEMFYRAVADDAVQGEQAGRYIREVLDPERVAIVHDNQDYSKGIAERVQRELGNLAVGPFVINPEETDYSAVVAQVRDSGADVVFYGGYYAQAGPLARQLDEAGVEAQFVSDDGAKDPNFKVAGRAAEGVRVTCPCADPAEVPGGEDFVQGMQRKYGQPPGTFGAEAYDSVQLIAEALKDARADDSIEELRQRIARFLDEVDGFQGVAKPYTFNEQGNVTPGPEAVFVYEWNAQQENFEVLGSVPDLVRRGQQ